MTETYTTLSDYIKLQLEQQHSTYWIAPHFLDKMVTTLLAIVESNPIEDTLELSAILFASIELFHKFGVSKATIEVVTEKFQEKKILPKKHKNT